MASDNISQSILTTFSREITERVLKASATNGAEEIQKAVKAEYEKLDTGKARCLELRLRKLIEGKIFESESAERGFWLFFHEVLETAKDTDSKDSNKSDIHFFYNVWRRWDAMLPKLKKRHKRQATRNASAYPAPKISDSSKRLSAESTNTTKTADTRNIVRGICGGMEQHVLDGFSLESLEECLNVEMESMEHLGQKLSLSKADEYTYWLKDIKNVLAQKECNTMKVAFFGSTGSGKSSLINAVLKERLLPESSSGACTPFSIEIGYNDDPDPASQIRLVFHFVDKESWTQELERFFLVLKNVHGTNEESLARDDSDFKSMRDKLRLLCPNITSSQLQQMCADDIVEHENIADRLGECTAQTFSKANDAYMAINRLIRPPMKATSATKTEVMPLLWPLVKYIRLETRNDMLRHGITIVDIPGTLDINKARSAVAERQMKECSAVYIVAPSIRVSDDASAGDLLSKAFEYQFHLDRMALSIVATKCDDIGRPSDVAEDLGVGEEVTRLMHNLENKKKIIATLEAEEDKLKAELEKVEREMQTLKDLITEHKTSKHAIVRDRSQGRSVLLGAGLKRKRALSTHSDDAAVSDHPVNEYAVSNGDLLNTVVEIKGVAQIDDIEADFDSKDTIARDIVDKIRGFRAEIKCLRDEASMGIPGMWQICIRARNQKNMEATKKSFANALQQFEEAGTDSTSLTVGTSNLADSDIDACTEDLRFFAVSAKAFENLYRRERKQVDEEDSMSLKSFKTSEETGIPALVDHCVEQAKNKRRAHAERLLKQIWMTRNGMYLSTSGAAFGDRVTEGHLEEAKRDLTETFGTMRQSIEQSTRKATDLIIDEAKSRILRKTNTAQQAAKGQADKIIERFGNSIKSHSTYRAIMTRGGAYVTHEGVHYDLNEELLRPFTDIIGPLWRTFFAERLPGIITEQQIACHGPVSQMLDAIAKKAKALDCPPKKIDLIKEQHGKYVNAFEDASNAYQQSLQFGQREARQSCKSTLGESLSLAYQRAGDIRGRHSLVNMKHKMSNHIASDKNTIFATAGSKLKKELINFHKESTQKFMKDISEVLDVVHRDCTTFFDVSKTHVSEAELEFRRELVAMLEEDRFHGTGSESKEVMKRMEASMTSST